MDEIKMCYSGSIPHHELGLDPNGHCQKCDPQQMMFTLLNCTYTFLHYLHIPSPLHFEFRRLDIYLIYYNWQILRIFLYLCIVIFVKYRSDIHLWTRKVRPWYMWMVVPSYLILSAWWPIEAQQDFTSYTLHPRDSHSSVCTTSV